MQLLSNHRLFAAVEPVEHRVTRVSYELVLENHDMTTYFECSIFQLRHRFSFSFAHKVSWKPGNPYEII